MTPFIVFYYISRLFCGGARRWIVGVLCMTMSIASMEKDKILRRISVLSREDYKTIMNASVYFTLTNEPIQKISLTKARVDYPDFIFQAAETNSMFKVDMLNEVKIVNVLAQSELSQNKYSCWVPYEFILNDEEEIKIQINNDRGEAPIHFKCDRPRKICMRLLMDLKIEDEYRTKFNNFKDESLKLRFEDEQEKQKELKDLRDKLYGEFTNDLKKTDEAFRQEMQKKEQEIQEKFLENTNLSDQNQKLAEELTNEKNQKTQFITTQKNEIEGLNKTIENLIKEKDELKVFNSELWDKFSVKEDEYNKKKIECSQVVLHRKLFAIAFLACLAGLIGCVLKMNYVFV